MKNLMAVLLNGVAQLEYDRDMQLTDYQLTYLDSMDSKMDEEGIDVAGEHIDNPDESQKAQFIVANLLMAMRSDNEGLTSALCTYLAHNMPDLKQIKIEESDNGEVSIEFVYDEHYKGQAAVEFTKH